MDGTANNYLGGNLGIGSASIDTTMLRISRSFTSTLATSIFLDSQVSSTNASANYIATSANTQAATFTTQIRHISLSQGTFGAGSTVTNQFGVIVGASMVGATNNYGFFGDIPSGTNRWNIYMAGTAANYMAGSLAIGTTSITTKLSVITAAGGNTSGFSVGSTVGLLNIWGGASSGVVFDVTNGTLNGATGTDLLFRQGGATVMLINSSQQVGIGVSSVSSSAAFQVDSITRGFLPPRMTATQRTAIASPAEGLIVVQTDGTQGLYLYIGAAWHAITML
jgi:hypothetical protein